MPPPASKRSRECGPQRNHRIRPPARHQLAIADLDHQRGFDLIADVGAGKRRADRRPTACRRRRASMAASGPRFSAAPAAAAQTAFTAPSRYRSDDRVRRRRRIRRSRVAQHRHGHVLLRKPRQERAIAGRGAAVAHFRQSFVDAEHQPGGVRLVARRSETYPPSVAAPRTPRHRLWAPRSSRSTSTGRPRSSAARRCRARSRTACPAAGSSPIAE